MNPQPQIPEAILLLLIALHKRLLTLRLQDVCEDLLAFRQVLNKHSGISISGESIEKSVNPEQLAGRVDAR